MPRREPRQWQLCSSLSVEDQEELGPGTANITIYWSQVADNLFITSLSASASAVLTDSQ